MQAQAAACVCSLQSRPSAISHIQPVLEGQMLHRPPAKCLCGCALPAVMPMAQMEGCELQRPAHDLRLTLMTADGPADAAAASHRFTLGARRVQRRRMFTRLEAEIGAWEKKRSTAENTEESKHTRLLCSCITSSLIH